MSEDNINKPAHYTQGTIECIDAIEAALTPEEFRGYLKGTAMKYIWRMNLKGTPLKCAKKAVWFVDRLRQHVGNLTTSDGNEIAGGKVWVDDGDWMTQLEPYVWKTPTSEQKSISLERSCSVAGCTDPSHGSVED